MPRASKKNSKLDLRSIGDKELAAMHRYQNAFCTEELSLFLDLDPPWAPHTPEKVKEKVDEVLKQRRTTLFAVYQGGKFVGIADYSAEWDTFSPGIDVFVWPEFRRKGLGRAMALHLLREAFGKGVAHTVGGFTADWNAAGIALMESLGFERNGRMRRLGIRGGRFYDGLFYTISRKEFEKRWRDVR